MTSEANDENPLLECVEFVLETPSGFSTSPLNCTLRPGQLSVIFGPIGAGKSILFERLAGIARPFITTKGSIRYPAHEHLGERRRPLILVPQDPRLTLLPTDRVRQVLLLELEGRTGPDGHELSTEEKRRQVNEILERLELAPKRVSDLPVQVLSTSERHRVLLARALLSRAPVIAYDGLAEGLTLAHRAQISILMGELLMEGRAIIASSRGDLPLDLPIHEALQLGAQTSFALPLLPKGESRAVSEGQALLEVRRLRVSSGKTGIFGTRSAAMPVDGASFSVRRGESLAIFGPGGAGKSTLMETISGLRRPAAGRVLFEGHDVTVARGRRGAQLRERVQLIFQDAANALAHERTVRQVLSKGPKFSPTTLSPEQWLERLGLRADLLDVASDFLSVGEAQRVSLGRSLLVDPALILFDAPRQSGVDTDGGTLAALLSREKLQGRTFVLTTSDPDIARVHGDRTAIMFAGRILEIGATSSVFSHPAHPLTSTLIAGGKLPRQEPEHPKRACPFADVCPRSRPEDCAQREPSLAPVSGLRGGLGHRVACFYPQPEPDAPTSDEESS